MLLYLKRPAPDQEPRLAVFLDGIRAAWTVSYRAFGTPRGWNGWPASWRLS